MTFEELGIKTKPGRTRYYTLCPKCSHLRQKHQNSECLTVNDEPGNRWYKCHHCGFAGNIDIMDKYKKVQENSNMPPQKPTAYSKKFREYLEGRKIDPKVALAENIFEYTVREDLVIGFPIYIGLTLVNVKFYNFGWTEGMKKPRFFQLSKELGTASVFIGLQSLSFEDPDGNIVKPRTVIITEGEWDMLSWKTFGYRNAISVPQGAPSPNSKKFESEFEYANNQYVQSVLSRDNVDLIILSTDDDEPGRLLRNHLAIIFGRDRCRYVNYPPGYKDINEVSAGSEKKGLPALGKKGVDECYRNLSAFPAKGIIRPRDIREELRIYARDGFTPGLGIGVPEVDRLFTIKPPLLMFLTGIPGSGKTTWWRWYMTEFTRNNAEKNIKWGLFTPENRPISREYAKISEVLTGQNFKSGTSNSMSDLLRENTLNYIDNHFFIISPDRNNFETWDGKIQLSRINTLESILNYLIYLKKTENIFGYVIDAWNKIEHEQPKYVTDTNFISQQLDFLVSFNVEYDLFGCVIVHPKKIDVQGINYKMPSLYDIKGSSAWKEKADIGVIAHRYKLRRKKKNEIPAGADEDDKYDVVENAPTIIRTEKIRFEETGTEDRIKMVIDNKKGNRFFPMKDEPKPEVQKSVGRYDSKKKEDDLDNIDLFDDKADDLPF